MRDGSTGTSVACSPQGLMSSYFTLFFSSSVYKKTYETIVN
uniref:Uncharacterized protein n=1 Tax=Syphacia muris TaxID=451379 RepID=A0A0N5ACF6_9BILA